MLQFKILKAHVEVKKELDSSVKLIPDINNNLYSQHSIYQFTFYKEQFYGIITTSLKKHLSDNKSIRLIVTRLRDYLNYPGRLLDLPFSKVNFFRIKYRYL